MDRLEKIIFRFVQATNATNAQLCFFSSLVRFILLPGCSLWGNLYRNPARVSMPEAQVHCRFSFCAGWDQEQTGSAALSLSKQQCVRRWDSLRPQSFNSRPCDTSTGFRVKKKQKKKLNKILIKKCIHFHSAAAAQEWTVLMTGGRRRLPWADPGQTGQCRTWRRSRPCKGVSTSSQRAWGRGRAFGPSAEKKGVQKWKKAWESLTQPWRV